MKRKPGFYIFVTLLAALVAVTVWGIVQNTGTVHTVSDELPQDTSRYIRTQETRDSAMELDEDDGAPPVVEATAPNPDNMDPALYEDSLEDGYTDTQKTGELGSLQGVLVTRYPMKYKPTKYERFENSPLIRFTDDMVWQSGENEFTVRRDAIADQAYHYQETSVALNISERIEYGQLSGFRFVEIPEGTLFSKLGIVSGDVLLTINGTMPDMEPMALTFMNMVAGKQGHATIEIEHKGKKRLIELKAAE